MDTRRNFLKKSAALTAYGLLHNWASAMSVSDRLGEVLPMRQIIRNGEKTTTFCLGGWHMGEGEPDGAVGGFKGHLHGHEHMRRVQGTRGAG